MYQFGTRTGPVRVARDRDGYHMHNVDKGTDSHVPIVPEAQGPQAVDIALAHVQGPAAAFLAGLLRQAAPPARVFGPTSPLDVRLQTPFPCDAIQWLPNRTAAYSHKSAYTHRISAAAGTDWERTVFISREREEEDKQGNTIHVIACRTLLRIQHRSVQAFGTQRNPDWETALKGSETDSLKRAAALHGVGAYLKFLDADAKKALPAWATPGGYALFYLPVDTEKPT